MLSNFSISKENINFYLNELSKEIKRLSEKGTKIELILVGGASVILNYTFRNSSSDLDGYYQSDILKQAILNIADKLDLPNAWLNNDFIKTASFSPKIIQYSKFYKEFNNCLSVRTVEGKYLVAMKLVSFRKYKNDISDIVGIISSESIAYDQIMEAIVNLYGNTEIVNLEALEFIKELCTSSNLQDKYKNVKKKELETRQNLKNKH